jgi:hypothetical protein
MNTVKVDKDVYIRDRYGVRIRAFVAGSEVDQDAYDKAVNPQDHPTSTGVYLPKSMTKEEGAMETKQLPVVNAEAKRVEAQGTANDTEVVDAGLPVDEADAKEEKPAKADAKAKK